MKTENIVIVGLFSFGFGDQHTKQDKDVVLPNTYLQYFTYNFSGLIFIYWLCDQTMNEQFQQIVIMNYIVSHTAFSS